MAERGGRHWGRAGLERKIRAAGRPWRLGDIVMVADGQWAVGLTAPAAREADTVAERRTAAGRRVEMTLEELARAVDARFGDTYRNETTDQVSVLLSGCGAGTDGRVLVGDVRGEPERCAGSGVSEWSRGDGLADEPQGGVRVRQRWPTRRPPGYRPPTRQPPSGGPRSGRPPLGSPD